MTGMERPSAQTSLYRFLRPGAVEIETGEFPDEDAAVSHARELSGSHNVAVTVEHHDHVDWEYLAEVDERPD